MVKIAKIIGMNKNPVILIIPANTKIAIIGFIRKRQMRINGIMISKPAKFFMCYAWPYLV